MIDTSTEALQRYWIPKGGGVQPHDAGRLYLRDDVDAAIADLSAERDEAVDRADRAETALGIECAFSKAARAEIAALRAEVERLRAFIAEFAAADFAPEPLPPKRHPEDEVEPVTDAAQVWAWQSDAREVLKGGANG